MIEILFGTPPDRGNAREHWRTVNKKKNLFYEECDNKQLLGLIPPPPKRPITKCKVEAHFKLHNPNDWDNLYARLKYPLDWLETRGYILDDSPRVIIEAPVVTQEVDRKNKCLSVTITPT